MYAMPQVPRVPPEGAHRLRAVDRYRQTRVMAVAVGEVVDVVEETQRRLRVIAPDDPGRDALEASLSDLRLLHGWLTTNTTASSATRLSASRLTIDRATQLLREIHAP